MKKLHFELHHPSCQLHGFSSDDLALAIRNEFCNDNLDITIGHTDEGPCREGGLFATRGYECDAADAERRVKEVFACLSGDNR